MGKSFTEYIPESTWFFKFLPKERDDYLELLKAANYLNVQSLQDLCCAFTAFQITKRSKEECREYFGIVNDFTPEEEERNKLEEKWAEEAFGPAPKTHD